MSEVQGRSQTSGPGSLARGLAGFLFVASLLVVLFAGTFPFDFAVPAQSTASREVRQTFDWQWVQYDPHYIDRIENLLFLMPFGFALAAVIPGGRHRAIWQVVAALLASALLSITIEVLQTFVSFRDPSLMDVWCNTVGGAIGAFVYVLIGDRLLKAAANVLLHLRPLARPSILGSLLLLYALFQLAGPLALHHAGDMSVWDKQMPMLVGNELGGDRGWNGSISDIVLADRAASDDEIMALSRGADPGTIFEKSLLAHYSLHGKAPYPDQTGNQPPLDWAGEPSLVTAEDAVHVSPQNWLKTATPVENSIVRIGRASQFTLATTAATFATHQEGLAPWRLVGISAGVSARNVQIGQDGPDLVVRVRTAVRSMPDLYIRDVFADLSTHNIAVTQKEGVVIIYVDGAERGRCEITPEAKQIWRLYPRGGFRLRLERYGFRSYALIYRLLVMIPFAALLGAMLMTSRWSAGVKAVLAVVVIVSFVLALESILGEQSASGFQKKNLWISLAIGFGVLGALTLWRESNRGRDGARGGAGGGG